MAALFQIMGALKHLGWTRTVRFYGLIPTTPAKNYVDEVATKIKSHEGQFDPLLTPGLPFVVRLDGCSFKNYTNGLTKPFDSRLALAMILTMNSLMHHTGAVTGFTQSDEITLLFPGDTNVLHLPFNGRLSKIVSVFAGLASAKFNHYMQSFDYADRSERVKTRIKSGGAFFDARAFSLPDPISAMEAILWRHKFDCRRNAIHTLGIAHFSHKQLQNCSLAQVMELLRSERGIEVFRDIPKVYLFGTFAKRTLVSVPYHNPKTGESGDILRSRLENRIFDWRGSNEEKTHMVFAKMWEPTHPVSVESLETALPIKSISTTVLLEEDTSYESESRTPQEEEDTNTKHYT